MCNLPEEHLSFFHQSENFRRYRFMSKQTSITKNVKETGKKVHRNYYINTNRFSHEVSGHTFNNDIHKKYLQITTEQ